MTAADRRMAPRQSSHCKLLIIVLHANREHRRDAYATLGSATCLTPRAFRAAPCNPSSKCPNSSGTKCLGKRPSKEPSRRVRYDRAQLIPEVFLAKGVLEYQDSGPKHVPLC